MTLKQISSWINRNLRYKLVEEQIILIIDMVHKLFCDVDMDAFKYWYAELTIYSELTFVSAAYTNCVAGDVGKTVVGGTSGSTGTLISYNNTTRVWVVSTTDTFTKSEAVTITAGTGAGTLEATDWQLGYQGPYAFPTDPPVRKMIGITTITDAAIFGVDAVYLSDLNDYGIFWDAYNDKNFYQKFRLDRFAKTLMFVNRPNWTGEQTYRWVYFRTGETITDLDADDSKFLVDEQFHMEFIEACQKVANVPTEDGKFDRADIEQFAWGWWNRLRKNYTPNGKASNQTNQGNMEAVFGTRGRRGYLV